MGIQWRIQKGGGAESTLNKCAVMRIGTPANKHVSIRDSVADSEGGGGGAESTLNKCAVMRIGTPANKHVSIRDSVADSEGGGGGEHAEQMCCDKDRHSLQ